MRRATDVWPADLRAYLFGTPRYFVRDSPLAGTGLPRALPLLAYLLLHRGAPVERRLLAFTLWPDVPEPLARTNLRRHLHGLRNMLAGPSHEPAWLESGAAGISLCSARLVWCDLDAFEANSREGGDRRSAVAHYSGDLLEGVEDEWIAPIRERMRTLQAGNLRALLAAADAAGDVVAALEWAERLLAFDPWSEPSVRGVMERRHSAGDRAGALAAYRSFEERLHSEFDAEPANRTRVLRDRIASRRSDIAYGGLPNQTSSLIGRDDELARVRGMLGENRIVTLVGTGGVGKTRLAVAAAGDEMHRYADGVVFVELSGTAGPDLEDTVASALEARGFTSAGVEATTASRLIDVSALIVLDTAEHVLEAASALVGAVVRAAPDVRFLVTSREPLDVRGERIARVDPLPEDAACRLFVERARTAGHDVSAELPAVAAICGRLDGLPLAIELAAARVASIGVHQLVDRLDDALGFLSRGRRDSPPHQRALRATLDWSYRLLNAAERRLFAHIGVFEGGWTLEAAARVCAHPGADPLAAIAALVDKSLVFVDDRHAERRYRLLDTTHVYARERLDASGERDETRRRHAAYVAELVERIEGRVVGRDQLAALGALDAERDNIVTALEFSVRDGAEPLLGLRIATAMWRHWLTRGAWSEGKAWLSAALARAEGAPDAMVARACHRFASLCRNLGNLDLAMAHYRRSLALRRQLDDDAGIAEALHGAGVTARTMGNFEEARELAEASLHLRAARHDAFGIARAHNELGAIALNLGAIDDARAWFATARETLEAIGDERASVLALGNLGLCELFAGDAEASAPLLQQSVSRSRAVGDRYFETYMLRSLADAMLERGDVTGACTSLRGAFAAMSPVGALDLRVRAIETAADLAFATDCGHLGAALRATAAAAREEWRMPLPPSERAFRERVALRFDGSPSGPRSPATWPLDDAIARARAFLVDAPK